jgi:hypothetical protein
MLVGIHQLHYLPWLRYFEKIARCDVFIVLDNIQFNKNGWQNRNHVKTRDGSQLLTVPVHSQYGQMLDEVRIDSASSWRKKHLQTLRQAYGKAPFFEEYAPFLDACYGRSWTYLNELNREMLNWFLEVLSIDTPVVYASDLNVPGQATERLINLIRAVGGDRYYSGAFALDAYLDAALLEEAQIGLELQHWSAPAYPQGSGEFIPDLAMIDLLFHCGSDSKSVLMGQGSPDREHIHDTP